ncbi:MAG TPA: TonB family protein [Dongiaceae bacterium]|nr:TonB family protein [Dongiaceae bacterium]
MTALAGPRRQASAFEARPEALRWGASLLLILLLHLGLGYCLALHQVKVLPPPPPPESVLIDLAPVAPPPEIRKPVGLPPLAVAPAEPLAAVPAPRVTVEPLPAPPRTPALPVPPAAQARSEPAIQDIPRLSPPPPPPPVVKPPRPKPASPQKAAVNPNAAPVSQPKPVDTEARIQAWQNAFVDRLRKSRKDVMLDARLRGVEAVALVSFSLDRNGRLLSLSIIQSTGFPQLDHEAVREFIKAQPLPPPPPELVGKVLQVTWTSTQE